MAKKDHDFFVRRTKSKQKKIKGLNFHVTNGQMTRETSHLMSGKTIIFVSPHCVLIFKSCDLKCLQITM